MADAFWRRRARRVFRLVRLAHHVLVGLAISYTFLPWLRDRRNPRAAHATVRWWTRRLVRILAVEVVVEGRARGGPTLYVANHVSWLDIPLLRSIVDTHFVSKEEVRRWPAIGILAGRSGTLFFERGNGQSAARVAERMTWRLARGESMLIFPEGTTSTGHRVSRFHPRLYAPAVHTGVWVQAVALTYHDENGRHPDVPFIDDQDFLPHLWKLSACSRIVARLKFCEPLLARGGERRKLAEANYAQVHAVVAHAPTPTVEHENTRHCGGAALS